MQIRHNTSLLEQAVEHVVQRASIPVMQAQADALERTNRAVAIRRIATGAAVAIVAVGLGFGIKLALERDGILPSAEPSLIGHEQVTEASNQVTKADLQRPQPKTETTEKGQPPTAPSAPEDGLPSPTLPPDQKTVNYTKFSNQSFRLGGRTWLITAGHHFESEDDKSWEVAWCYTQADVDGVSLKVDLARRSGPDQRPLAPTATPKTLETAGLTAAEALVLASKCAWLDKEYSVGELEPAPNTQSPFKPPLRTSLSNRVLTVRGPIEANFTQTISQFDFDVLEIDSIGGLLDEAMKAGRRLRAQAKDVKASGSCLSACVLILAGGVSRDALPDARVGVHRFRGDQATDKDLEIAQQKSSELISYLSDMGISVELFHAASAVPSDDMRYLTRSDMQKWSLITGPRVQPNPEQPQTLPPSPTEPVPTSTVAANGRVEAHSRAGWSLSYSSELLAIRPDANDTYDERLQSYDTAWSSTQHREEVVIYVQVSNNRRCGDAKRYVDEQLLPRRNQVTRSQAVNTGPARTSYVIEGRGVGQRQSFDQRAFIDLVSIRRDDPSSIVHVGGRFPVEHAEIYRAEVMKMLNSMKLPEVDPFRNACAT
ncbi:hypothetical protein [Microvirga vignae]|uniref:COG3904 family protein n=1 Tax=Microvirga vignae TaxID=1225564 RepID=UPI000A6DDB9C|nr:hypothetical protein [Microvirga vignae]